MYVTQEEIERKCRNMYYVEEGHALYEKGKVFIISEEEETACKWKFIGRVKEYFISNTPQVSIDYKREQDEYIISDYECTCNQISMRNRTSICKHIVGLICEVNDLYADNEEVKTEEGKTNLKTSVKTSEELLKAMDNVRLEERSRFCEMMADGDVELEPTLHLEVLDEKIDFRIGRNTKYVVKDVYELADNIRKQKYVVYGKKFEFAHTQSSFTKKSQKLVNMVLENIVEADEYTYNYYINKSAQEKRYLKLNQKMLDDFFECYKEETLNISSCIEGYEVRAKVVEENPLIKVKIAGDEESVRVLIPQIIYIEGIKKSYVYYEKKLYICSEEYSKEMKVILNMITSNYTLQERKSRRQFYYIAPKGETDMELSGDDYSSFCVTLLPIMKKYMDVSIKGIDFDKYRQEEGEYKVYFDINEDGYIICHGEAVYGDNIHNIMKPATLKETYRDIKTEYELRTLIESYMTGSTVGDTGYVLYDNDELLAKLIEYGVGKIMELAEVYVSKAFSKLRVKNNVKINTGISIKGNLLDVSWDVEGMKNEEVMEVLESYKKQKKYHRLRNGELLNIYESGMDVLALMMEDMNLSKTQLKEGMAEIPVYRALYLDTVMRENANIIQAQRDASFCSLIKDFEEIKNRQYDISDNVMAELRHYQHEGFKWLNILSDMNFGGILADDMGLGKTLQIITYLASKKLKTNIVIAPASLVYNWGAEFEKFAPALNVALVAGCAEERKKIINNYKEYDVLITSYDLLKRDIALYENKCFECQVIDEAQYIKNPSTQGAKAVKSINAKTRFALTGTPVENRLSELWSIFDYLMPGYLYSYKRFKEIFEEKILCLEDGNESEKTATKRLHQMISPFVLRRLKRDVLKELPDKVEKVVYSKFEAEQDKLYKASEKNIINTIKAKSSEDINKEKLMILAELTKLRQICCDPHLLYDDYKGSSAKLDTCVEMTKEAIAGGHKILIFSQFTSMLSIIEKCLLELNIKSFLLTGQTSKVKRRELVNRFQNNEADVFLISLKAGGTGLNLTEADMVIHFDPWWNIAAQNQATDRAHRIGQVNTVTEIKLIAKGTIEERILKLQEKKKHLADKIISEENISMSSISRDELMELFS